MMRIACVNHCSLPVSEWLPSGMHFSSLVSALHAFVMYEFGPVWGVKASLYAANKDHLPPPTDWVLAFLDDADAADALGYHDVTAAGLPIGKVFVKTTLEDKQVVSVTASHELAEMLVDPGINLCAVDYDNKVYAYEVADPVEDQTVQVNGFDMSSFVYPQYFEPFRQPGSTKFDHMNALRAPFTLTPGGYLSVLVNGQWSQVFGESRSHEIHKHRVKDRMKRAAQPPLPLTQE